MKTVAKLVIEVKIEFCVQKIVVFSFLIWCSIDNVNGC